MPEGDVSDLRDVVDAINKLCDTMKTSYEVDGELDEHSPSESAVQDGETLSQTSVDSQEQIFSTVGPQYYETVSQTSTDSGPEEIFRTVGPQYRNIVVKGEEIEVEVRCVTGDIELISPEEVMVQKPEVFSSERWSDTASLVSLPGQGEEVEAVTSDTEPAIAQCEPVSEMYYTASSEVSLLSDSELPEKVQNEHEDDKDAKVDRKECVIAGHVAAMRERFESMTRTNTPCPDLMRSLSPSLEVFRNTSPSPDRLA